MADIIPMGGQDVWSRESHEAVREFIEASMGEPLQVTFYGFQDIFIPLLAEEYQPDLKILGHFQQSQMK